jgi:hypothetical protein
MNAGPDNLPQGARKPSAGFRVLLAAAAIAGLLLIGVTALGETPVATTGAALGTAVESVDATDNHPIGYFADLFLGRMGDAESPQGF